VSLFIFIAGDNAASAESTRMAYSFNDVNAAERHTIECFEMSGNRALYYNGWYARTIHRALWDLNDLSPLEDDAWDLQNPREDYSLANNLADEYLEKLKEMKSLFMWQAEKYHALSIDDRVIVRMNAEVAGRPAIMAGKTSLTL
jgi:arylsulfatase A-like enzyme